ncbi:hypothetical protein [Sinorhizobium meliloti]|uniref:hypothetical protein n=1 Tax=Rhizobium meliloti TaxID=382 RepID=UPI001F3A732D|nr:hypothetical protein [Sinorhizobium meliloti]
MRRHIAGARLGRERSEADIAVAQERPIASLAARSPTQDRLARLEGSGAIAGYTVVEGTPRTIVQATHLLARFESGKTCDQIAPRLKGIPFVTRLAPDWQRRVENEPFLTSPVHGLWRGCSCF